LGIKEDTEPREKIKGVDDGVVIRGILPYGPAAKSELRRDDIIATVDGRTGDYHAGIAQRNPRQENRPTRDARSLSSAICRRPKRLTVRVSPAEFVERPAEIVVKKSGPTPKDAPPPAPTADLGLTIQPLTADLAEQFSVVATEGVMVATVEKNGLADRQNIKPGDVITAINHQPITRVREFRDALRGADLKKGLLLDLVSGGTARFEILKEKK
jgi:serine protease Do